MEKTKHLLGEDKHGFRYFLASDNYIYQQYPDTPWWKNERNMQGQKNGWYCSVPAWDRTMHKCII